MFFSILSRKGGYSFLHLVWPGRHTCRSFQASRRSQRLTAIDAHHHSRPIFGASPIASALAFLAMPFSGAGFSVGWFSIQAEICPSVHTRRLPACGPAGNAQIDPVVEGGPVFDETKIAEVWKKQ